jgi:hypothetical protein
MPAVHSQQQDFEQDVKMLQINEHMPGHSNECPALIVFASAYEKAHRRQGQLRKLTVQDGTYF